VDGQLEAVGQELLKYRLRLQSSRAVGERSQMIGLPVISGSPQAEGADLTQNPVFQEVLFRRMNPRLGDEVAAGSTPSSYHLIGCNVLFHRVSSKKCTNSWMVDPACSLSGTSSEPDSGVAIDQ
jgi:hypothetical protein